MNIQEFYRCHKQEGYFVVKVEGYAELTIPYFDLLDYACKNDKNLEKYLNKFKEWDEKVDDLYELNYPFKRLINNYIENCMGEDFLKKEFYYQ